MTLPSPEPMRFQPIVGEIDATGCGAFITYQSDDLLSRVTFTIRPNLGDPRNPAWDGTQTETFGKRK